MPENRSQRGVPLPGVWQVCVLAAALAAAWIFWSEFRRQTKPQPVDARHDAGATFRSILTLSKEGQAGLDRLTTLLDSDDRDTRRNALLALAEMGPQGEQALSAIRLRFSDQDSSVRQAALMAFSKICDDQEQILAATAGFLSDSELQPRQFASTNLQAAGPSAIPVLIAMAHSESADARLLVVRLLADADEDRDPGEVNAALRSLLDDRDGAVRVQAIAAIVARGAAELDEVRGWLREEDPKVVSSALGAIRWFGPDSVAVLPELQRLLEDTSGTHPVPLAALAFLKTAARPLIPALLKRRSAGSPHNRFYAARALAEIGADPSDVVPLIVPLLDQKDDYNVCWEAGRLLARIDPDEGKRQVSRLIEQIAARESQLDGKDPDVQALFGLRSLAKEAVSLLIRLLSHTDWYVRSMAMATLGGIGPDAASAVPTLIGFIDRKPTSLDEIHNRGPAVQALGGVGFAARPAVPRLVEMINGKSHDAQLRDDIVRALGPIGEASPEAISVLRRELTLTVFQGDLGPFPQDSRTRVHALQSLVLLAGDSATTLADAIPLLDDNEPGLRMQAALAIGRISGDRRKAIARLVETLADRNFYVRTTAALALGQIGPDAGAALPILRNCLGDSRDHVPNWARRTSARAGSGFPNVELQFMPDGVDLQRFSVAEAARWAIAAIETPAVRIEPETPSSDRR